MDTNKRQRRDARALHTLARGRMAQELVERLECARIPPLSPRTLIGRLCPVRL